MNTPQYVKITLQEYQELKQASALAIQLAAEIDSLFLLMFEHGYFDRNNPDVKRVMGNIKERSNGK